MRTKLELIYLILLAFTVGLILEDIPSEIVYLSYFSLFIKSGLFPIRPWQSRLITMALATVLCFFHWKFFGTMITTEAMVSFMIAIVSIRFVQRPNQFLSSDLILSLLIISGVSLFSNNLMFLILVIGLFFLCVLILQKDFFSDLGTESIKNILKLFLLVAPLTLSFFIFFPRFRSFLPTAGQNYQGQVGYSGQINNSNTSQLRLSQRIAFYAQLPDSLKQVDLYWRGRTLELTDGYNWKTGFSSDVSMGRPQFSGAPQEYTIKYEQGLESDLVLLDVPSLVIESNTGQFFDHKHLSFRSYFQNKKATVKAISYLGVVKQRLNQDSLKQFLQKPGFIPNKLQDLANQIQAPTISQTIDNFALYLKRHNFRYTLSPGPMPTLTSFLDKKLGYCGHYSALLALTLRVLNIPSRVVTGFQGGIPLDTGLIAVRNQDAHAWVEYYHQGTWNRVDPTAFVAPDRVTNVAYFDNEGVTTKEKSRMWSGLYKIQSTLYSLNYRLSAFMDEFDRNFQEKIAAAFKLSINWFYGLGLTVVLIITFTFWWARRKISKTKIHPVDHLFYRFTKKLSKKGIEVTNRDTITLIENKILNSNFTQKQNAVKILKHYEKLRYSKRPPSLTEFKEMVKTFR